MEIILGKTAGFCYGVKRAVDGTEKAIKEEKNLFCLGELVHNKQVTNSLQKKGLKFIENIEEANGKTIIRAHGVPHEVYKTAQKNEVELLDYTCPNVLKIHKIAKEYKANGYYICLCGSKKHPENIGTISYCGKYYSVIEEEKELPQVVKEIKGSKLRKVLLISQTTYSLTKFNKIEQLLKEKMPKNIEFIVNNTICKATEFRQKETEEISKKVDGMIIIGGKNSSNTKKLFDIAKHNCQVAICIETVDDLKTEQILDYNKVGIMAGASTPKQSIEEVIKTLENLFCRNMR